MKYLIIISILVSCNSKPRNIKEKYCIVSNIQKMQKSSLDISDKYIIVTNCGKITTFNKYKKGDKIKINIYE